MLQVQRPSPWSSVCVSVAVVSLVAGAGAASFEVPILPIAFVWLAGANLIGAVVCTLLGIGGRQQLRLGDHFLRVHDETFARGDLLGVEVSGRDLILVLRRSARVQTRQVLRFHHAPHELAQLARYLRGWHENPSLQAGDPLPAVRRDASLLERLRPLGATADGSGVHLRVEARRVTDMLWVLPVLLAAGLSIAFEMPFLVILGLALLSFAGFVSLWGKRGVLHLDDTGMILPRKERLAWASVRGATVDGEGVVVHLTDATTRKILLTLRKPLLAEVITDLAAPDEEGLPEEGRRLQQLRQPE